MKTCPKCERPNDENVKKCVCKYVFKEKPQGKGCAYSHQGQKCPLSGAITETTLAGPNTQWYCKYHYQYWEDPKSAQQALFGLLNGDIKVERVNWREKLINEEMEKLKKTNSELFFKPQNAQDRKDRAEVCMSFMQHKIRTFVAATKRSV